VRAIDHAAIDHAWDEYPGDAVRNEPRGDDAASPSGDALMRIGGNAFGEAAYGREW
jgi:hypothetical protein